MEHHPFGLPQSMSRQVISNQLTFFTTLAELRIAFFLSVDIATKIVDYNHNMVVEGTVENLFPAAAPENMLLTPKKSSSSGWCNSEETNRVIAHLSLSIVQFRSLVG